MIAPWMITKRVCELPLIGETIRNFCLKTLAKVQLGDDIDQANGFFCSRLSSMLINMQVFPYLKVTHSG
ncbi:hypothetical protein AB6E88_08580 [Providencia hangzhouensis]